MSAISPDLNRRKGPEAAAMRGPDGASQDPVAVESDDGDAAAGSIALENGAEEWDAMTVSLARGRGPFRRLPPPRPEDYDW